MLVIGSKALQAFGDKYISNAKRSWDWDIICSYDDFLTIKNDILKKTGFKKIVPINDGKKILLLTSRDNFEFEITWDGSTAQKLLDICLSNNLYKAKTIFSTNNVDIKLNYANPDVIFTLKKSHRFLRNSPYFLKTMQDYRHLRDIGCEIPECLKDWYKERVRETYWYGHPKLNMSKEAFFSGDNIPYIYDHDSIHRAVAHLDKPAYEYYKPENEEVQCSKRMFFSCSEQMRLYGVLEESYVLALERSQIPAPGAWTPKKSFEVALQKVCSSITSGWFREYAYENYFNVLSLYKDDYVDRFWDGVRSGIVIKNAAKTQVEVA